MSKAATCVLRMSRTVERVGEEDGGKADGHKDHQVIPAAVGTSRSHQVSVVQRDFAMGRVLRC